MLTLFPFQELISSHNPISHFKFLISHLQHRILRPRLFLRVVGGEVKATALFADGGAFGNEVADGDHVAQFAQLWAEDGFS